MKFVFIIWNIALAALVGIEVSRWFYWTTSCCALCLIFKSIAYSTLLSAIKGLHSTRARSNNLDHDHASYQKFSLRALFSAQNKGKFDLTLDVYEPCPAHHNYLSSQMHWPPSVQPASMESAMHVYRAKWEQSLQLVLQNAHHAAVALLPH